MDTHSSLQQVKATLEQLGEIQPMTRVHKKLKRTLTKLEPVIGNVVNLRTFCELPPTYDSCSQQFIPTLHELIIDVRKVLALEPQSTHGFLNRLLCVHGQVDGSLKQMEKDLSNLHTELVAALNIDMTFANVDAAEKFVEMDETTRRATADDIQKIIDAQNECLGTDVVQLTDLAPELVHVR